MLDRVLRLTLLLTTLNGLLAIAAVAYEGDEQPLDALPDALPEGAPNAIPVATLDTTDPFDGLPEEECEPPEPGFLSLDTKPWTVVYVDGQYVGSTPLFRHRLPPGEHTLTLVNEGKDVRSEEVIEVEEGRVRKLKLVLALDESAPSFDTSGDATASGEDCFIPVEEQANLTVSTQPWSQVFMDGKLIGSTPLFKQPIASGDHVVRMVRDDGTASFARFSATVGETVKLSLDL